MQRWGRLTRHGCGVGVVSRARNRAVDASPRRSKEKEEKVKYFSRKQDSKREKDTPTPTVSGISFDLSRQLVGVGAERRVSDSDGVVVYASV